MNDKMTCCPYCGSEEYYIKQHVSGPVIHLRLDIASQRKMDIIAAGSLSGGAASERPRTT